LTDLKTILLSDNSINGTIPDEIGALKFLSRFDVSHNQIEGPFPLDLTGKFPVLRTLNIANNNFTGTIPESIASITFLNQLDISNNSFSGSIPGAFISRLSRLRDLSLSGNNLRGVIPKEICPPNDLEFIRLEIPNEGDTTTTRNEFVCYPKW
jgi:Leucine-rich repeat (LRR) protein